MDKKIATKLNELIRLLQAQRRTNKQRSALAALMAVKGHVA